MRSLYDARSGVYSSPREPAGLSSLSGNLPTVIFSTEPPDGRVALIDAPTGRVMLRSELKASLLLLAASLKEKLGIRHGDVVMMLAPNSIHYPLVFLAVMSLGAAVTTVNPLNTRQEVEKQVLDSGAKLVFTVSGLIDKVSGFGLPVVLIDNGSVDDSSVVSTLDGLLKQGFREVKEEELGSVSEDDTAALLYSSGTTGTSKGVVLSHKNLVSAAAMHNWASSPAVPDDVFLCVIPMFHVFGFVIITCAQLRRGVPIVVMPQFDFETMLKVIQKYRVTNIPVVPPVVLALSKSPLVSKYDLSSLTEIASGAAPLGREVIEACLSRFPGVNIRQGYGLTESTAIGSIAIPGDTKHYGSAGAISPNMQAKIVDVASGQALPPNKRGEIWLRGPTIMQGYLGNPKATADTVDSEGWLHTGDLGYIDEGGNMYVVDRIKELIKFRGYQVAPAELEAVLLSHPEILDAAVIPFPDEEAGQIPLAVIVRGDTSKLDEEAVKSFVAEQVAPYKKIRRVIFVASIPKSPSGKILRRELVTMNSSRL